MKTDYTHDMKTQRRLWSGPTQAIVSGLIMLFAGACSPPVEAPTQFNELCSFIFQHADDEDPQALADGVVNLQEWLKTRRTEVAEGYMVDNLDPDVVKTLDGQDHDLTDLLGVAFSTTFDSTIDQSMEVTLTDDPSEQSPDLWKSYSRTNDPNVACFLAKTCDTLEYDVTAEQRYPLGLESTVRYHARIRRVMTEAGEAVIWRTWLNGPNQFNWDWVQVKLNFYLGVSVRTSETTMERTEASWMLANMGDSPVPPDVALSLALDTVKEGAEQHRERMIEKFGASTP